MMSIVSIVIILIQQIIQILIEIILIMCQLIFLGCQWHLIINLICKTDCLIIKRVIIQRLHLLMDFKIQIL